MAADDPRDGHQDGKTSPAQLRREISALREVLQSEIDGIIRAGEVLAETVNRTPTVIQTEISHLRELMAEKLDSLGGTAEEKFNSIALQFKERDIRTEQADKARAEALAAALQAAKEAVAEQTLAAAKAADKTELSFSKLIEQTQLQITTVAEGLGDKIGDLKGRLDRGEGNSAGSADTRNEQRLNINLVVGVIGAVIAVLLLYATFRPH